MKHNRLHYNRTIVHQAVLNQGIATLPAVVEATGLSWYCVWEHVVALRKDGLVQRVKWGKYTAERELPITDWDEVMNDEKGDSNAAKGCAADGPADGLRM